MNLDVNKLKQQADRLRAASRLRVDIPSGSYTGRIIDVEIVEDRWGRQAKKATFEITDGDQSGRCIAANIYGIAIERLLLPGWQSKRFTFRVYVPDGVDGRGRPRVDVETVREVGARVAGPEKGVSIPAPETIRLAAEGFGIGFECTGGIRKRRKPVDWIAAWNTMATAGAAIQEAVFGSAYSFSEGLLDHIAANDRKDEQNGISPRGSLEGFAGPHYSPLLTFDIDCLDEVGNGDVVAARRGAHSIVVELLGMGAAPGDILVFFSGSKGFHIHIPSMLAGACPAADFATTAKRFCGWIAERCDVRIDNNLYSILQPLRAPNSRHEKTGLYKIRLDIDELIGLEIDAIKTLARWPRPTDPLALDHVPLPAMVGLWAWAKKNPGKATTRGTVALPEGAGARVTRSTWEYLINGVPEGQRATEHFKAAANLLEFPNVVELTRALLRRPAEVSGLPEREAEKHLQGAVQRRLHGR